MKPGIQPARRQQGGVRALLDHPAGVHRHDAVGVLDGGQAVGDDQRGAAAHQGLERGSRTSVPQSPDARSFRCTPPTCIHSQFTSSSTAGDPSMTTVSILQAWRRLSELVARAWRGKEFGITRPGEDLARREPLEALNASGQASALAARIRASRARSAAGKQRAAGPMADQVADQTEGRGGRTPLRDMVQLGRR